MDKKMSPKLKITIITIEMLLAVFAIIVTFLTMFVAVFLIQKEGILLWLVGLFSAIIGIVIATYLIKKIITLLPKKYRDHMEQTVDDIIDNLVGRIIG